MEKFLIHGGAPLSGTVVPAGNKNGALPILAASVLTEDEIVVRNVPRIKDVEAMLGLLDHMGVRVAWTGENEVTLCAGDLSPDCVEVDRPLSERIRASFLLAGPLLARFGRAVMPPPGGDVIGRRRLDPHLDAFRALGADFTSTATSTCARRGGLRATTSSWTSRPSWAPRTRCWPPRAPRHDRHRQRRVRAARPGPRADAAEDGRRHPGDRLQRPHRVGPRDLHGCVHQISPDHIEIGSFMALAGVTGGELRIKDVIENDLRMIRLVFDRLGLRSSSTTATSWSPAARTSSWPATSASTR